MQAGDLKVMIDLEWPNNKIKMPSLYCNVIIPVTYQYVMFLFWYQSSYWWPYNNVDVISVTSS